MTLFVLSYLAGMLTILAPCILPVLPFVFARVDQPFARSGLPLLAGLVIGFGAVATLATLAGSWAADANEVSRVVALGTLALAGLAMSMPKLATAWSRPLVALGARLGDAAQGDRADSNRPLWRCVALGLATGLLWAPCAGPVLGLVLSTAALKGPSPQTALLLLTYAAGAATSLALALWAGGRVFQAMKRALGVGDWIRRALGCVVLAGVAATALGLDTSLVAGISAGGTDALEQRLLQRWHRKDAARATERASASVMMPVSMPAYRVADRLKAATRTLELPPEGLLPPLTGATAWLNSDPLTAQDLRGKVVLIDFWTFDCINCRNALPYVRGWAEKYKDQGLVVIGVHSPEFAFERQLANVKRAVRDLGLAFPIAVDNDFAIWRAFSNEYWPAHYFIDAQGRIRFHKFGEGDYERSEQVIRQLLDEARRARDGT